MQALRKWMEAGKERGKSIKGNCGAIERRMQENYERLRENYGILRTSNRAMVPVHIAGRNRKSKKKVSIQGVNRSIPQMGGSISLLAMYPQPSCRKFLA